MVNVTAFFANAIAITLAFSLGSFFNNSSFECWNYSYISSFYSCSSSPLCVASYCSLLVKILEGVIVGCGIEKKKEEHFMDVSMLAK